jgi:hypothetical protein
MSNLPNVSPLIRDSSIGTRLRYSGRPELLDHSDVKTMMIYTHVLTRGLAGVRSPFDGI